MPVQRSLPRPSDVNTAILRGAPHKDQKNRALYEVCLILFRASLADGVQSCSLRVSFGGGYVTSTSSRYQALCTLQNMYKKT